jgi:hypothetical protein
MKCVTTLTHEDECLLEFNDVWSCRSSPTFQRNVGCLLQEYTVLYHKRQSFTESLLSEPNIPNTEKTFWTFFIILTSVKK